MHFDILYCCSKLQRCCASKYELPHFLLQVHPVSSTCGPVSCDTAHYNSGIHRDLETGYSERNVPYGTIESALLQKAVKDSCVVSACKEEYRMPSFYVTIRRSYIYNQK